MKNLNNKQKNIIIILSILLLNIVFLFSIKSGSIDIPMMDIILGIFSGDNSNPHINIIRDIRVPRVLVAIIIGANLSVAGVLLQSIIRNPLADPSVTGISSGAALASVIILLFFDDLNQFRPILGFIGGLISCSMVYMLSYKKGLSPIRIVLAGIAINALLGSITNVLSMFSSNNLNSIDMWLSGSLATITWSDANILFIYSLIGNILALVLYKSCDIVVLGERNAKSLGFNYDLQMILISFIAIFLAGIATSIGGIISFVGLVVPHISRMIIGSKHKYLIPFSMILGSILLLSADTIGRIILKPIEIPVGIVMAIIGAPVFIYLLRRSEI